VITVYVPCTVEFNETGNVRIN